MIIIEGNCAFGGQVADFQPGLGGLQRFLVRGVPDGGGPGALLDNRLTHIGGGYVLLLGLDCRPAGRGNLQNPGVIEGVNRWVEIRVNPDRLQHISAHRVGISRVIDIHGTLDGRYLPGPFVGLTVSRPGDIVDLLIALAVPGPAFDNLHTVEVPRGRVLFRPYDEGRHFGTGGGQIAAHGHALGVS